jgi:hypothetical protein
MEKPGVVSHVVIVKSKIRPGFTAQEGSLDFPTICLSKKDQVLFTIEHREDKYR